MPAFHTGASDQSELRYSGLHRLFTYQAIFTVSILIFSRTSWVTSHRQTERNGGGERKREGEKERKREINEKNKA